MTSSPNILLNLQDVMLLIPLHSTGGARFNYIKVCVASLNVRNIHVMKSSQLPNINTPPSLSAGSSQAGVCGDISTAEVTLRDTPPTSQLLPSQDS